jgi:hypothetical protein
MLSRVRLIDTHLFKTFKERAMRMLLALESTGLFAFASFLHGSPYRIE